MNVKEVVNSQKFKKIVALRWGISVAMLLVLFVLYYGYVLTAAWNPEFMAKKVGENMTFGILAAAVVIVVAWLMTVIYVYWANTKYDKVVEELKQELD